MQELRAKWEHWVAVRAPVPVVSLMEWLLVAVPVASNPALVVSNLEIQLKQLRTSLQAR